MFEYALVDRSGKHDLAELRSLQDWNLRYALASVPGVAEVASVGGFVRQYQVQVDPERLRAFGIPLRDVVAAVRASNHESGGGVFEIAGHEQVIRGRGYVRDARRPRARRRCAPICAARRSSCATWRRSRSAPTCAAAWSSSTARARRWAASS